MICTILYCLLYKLRDNKLILCHAKIPIAVREQAHQFEVKVFA